jgi:ribokinase
MATPQPRVCVVGSCNIDLTFRTARLPRPGETLAGRAFLLGFGGKGANQAVMAARLGAAVAMVGKVGRDVFGERALANFRDQGIDTTHVATDEQEATGTAAILVDDAANNCILVVPGANQGLGPADVRAAAAVIEAADVLLCQLEVPVETTLEAFRIARAGGVRTVFNPAPAAELPDELFRLTDLCVPNETEAEQLTGVSVSSVGAATEAGHALRRRGADRVVVTLGERGAVLVDAEGVGHIPAPAVRAVDPSGAGDALIGSLAVFLAEGLPLRAALLRANGVAALSVTRDGTQAAFPTREEAAAFWQAQAGRL